MSPIPDISEQSFNAGTFPNLYVQEEFQHGIDQFYQNDKFDTLYYEYELVIKWIKLNYLNTQKVIFIKNAPLL